MDGSLDSGYVSRRDGATDHIVFVDLCLWHSSVLVL